MNPKGYFKATLQKDIHYKCSNNALKAEQNLTLTLQYI